ncbi:MAG: hypothetical protein LM577_03965 [Thermoproteaceae archaeon]|jgi:hypothetical protein|nr:hypothetical protein [Thermoproteaceae archaeon]
MPRGEAGTRVRGLTTVEALLIAAAFILVGVIGVLTFQGIGKSAAEALRAGAIVTADRGGFDITIEVLNGKLSGIYLQYGQSGQSLGQAPPGQCVVARNNQVQTGVTSSSINPPLVAGQSATCRFNVGQQLQPGVQYTYVVYAVDASSGKAVQVAKGVVTVGIS